MTHWEIIYRMTKDHNGDHQAALARIKEYAADMIELEEWIEGSKKNDDDEVLSRRENLE